MTNDKRTILKRTFVVTSDGVAVGVLTVETTWSDVERPATRIAVRPALPMPVIEARVVAGADARSRVELV